MKYDLKNIVEWSADTVLKVLTELEAHEYYSEVKFKMKEDYFASMSNGQKMQSALMNIEYYMIFLDDVKKELLNETR